MKPITRLWLDLIETGKTEEFAIKGEWQLHTFGRFWGTIFVEQYVGQGRYRAMRTLSAFGDRNFDCFGQTDENFYRVRFRRSRARVASTRTKAHLVIEARWFKL